MFADGGLESVVQFAQAMLENVGEADQDRQRDAAQHQAYRPVFSDRWSARILLGVHKDVPFVADRKISLPPTGNIVQFAGVYCRPSIGRLHNQGALSGVFFQLFVSLALRKCAARALRRDVAVQNLSFLRIDGGGREKFRRAAGNRTVIIEAHRPEGPLCARETNN